MNYEIGPQYSYNYNGKILRGNLDLIQEIEAVDLTSRFAIEFMTDEYGHKYPNDFVYVYYKTPPWAGWRNPNRAPHQLYLYYTKYLQPCDSVYLNTLAAIRTRDLNL